MAAFAERIRAATGVELHELHGARVAGELPVPVAVVNRLIAERLAASDSSITSAHVEPRQDNVINVDLTRSAFLLPRITLQAMIERQPEFPASPVLVLRWRIPAAGSLAGLAAAFISKLASLPPGVTIDADLISIDLRDILTAQGHPDLLPYVRALRVDTQPGGFVLKFELGIDGG